jgi:HSP20 family protein
VTVSGERTLPHDGDDVKYHRHERWHGSFSRTMQMPFRIDPESVEATYRNGVLGVTLPRAEEDKPRQISVS